MSELQHQRIVELCQELRLSAMPNVYSGIAQSAAAKFEERKAREDVDDAEESQP